tara:strand:- start:164 stop:316 length:153 start_codon:yes stop_codon:yes gene_type:complete
MGCALPFYPCFSAKLLFIASVYRFYLSLQAKTVFNRIKKGSYAALLNVQD